MVETRAVWRAVHNRPYTRIRPGESRKKAPSFRRGVFIIADYHLPIAKRLCKYTFDSMPQRRQASVGRYRNCNKGHLRFYSVIGRATASLQHRRANRSGLMKTINRAH